MLCIFKAASLVAFGALLSAGPAFPQTPAAESVKAATASPTAYVYVQTHQGVDVYVAASDGKLTLVR